MLTNTIYTIWAFIGGCVIVAIVILFISPLLGVSSHTEIREHVASIVVGTLVFYGMNYLIFSLGGKEVIKRFETGIFKFIPLIFS